jgi:hypothetical protein
MCARAVDDSSKSDARRRRRSSGGREGRRVIAGRVEREKEGRFGREDEMRGRVDVWEEGGESSDVLLPF